MSGGTLQNDETLCRVNSDICLEGPYKATKHFVESIQTYVWRDLKTTKHPVESIQTCVWRNLTKNETPCRVNSDMCLEGP